LTEEQEAARREVLRAQAKLDQASAAYEEALAEYTDALARAAAYGVGAVAPSLDRPAEEVAPVWLRAERSYRDACARLYAALLAHDRAGYTRAMAHAQQAADAWEATGQAPPRMTQPRPVVYLGDLRGEISNTFTLVAKVKAGLIAAGRQDAACAFSLIADWLMASGGKFGDVWAAICWYVVPALTSGGQDT
jgi:tetratricopeptide (TPR) repeat protein